MDALAQGDDGRIVHDGFGERTVPCIAPQYHCGSGVGQGVLRGKIIGWVWIAHDGGEPIGRHIDTLNLIRRRTQRREGVFERIQGRIDGIATGPQTEVVAADLPARAELMQQILGLKAFPTRLTQGFLNGIVLRGKASQGQVRRESAANPLIPPATLSAVAPATALV